MEHAELAPKGEQFLGAERLIAKHHDEVRLHGALERQQDRRAEGAAQVEAGYLGADRRGERRDSNVTGALGPDSFKTQFGSPILDDAAPSRTLMARGQLRLAWERSRAAGAQAPSSRTQKE